MKYIKRIATLCAALAIAACGGGDSTESTSERPLAVTSSVVFQDHFSRPDADALGLPIVGGAWTELNELFTTTEYRPARQGVVHPASIVLSDGTLTYRYADPQQGFLISHAQPVAYAALSRTVLSSTLSFDFAPPPDPSTSGGRVSHQVGLMTAASGFYTPNGLVPEDYAAHYPVTGIGVAVGRSSYAYSNSHVAIVKFDGANNGSNLGVHYLPFQFEPGVTYHFSITLADDRIDVAVSNGSSELSVSTPLDGFAFLVDQVFVLDEQAGNDGLRFDNILVMATDARLVQIDVKPGSFPNSINLSSAGVVPVAILSDASFDATRVDPASVVLGGGTVKLIGKGDRYSCDAQDANGDGLMDLVCHIVTDQMTIQPGDSIVVLEGNTLDGEAFRGQDSIRIVP